MLKGLPASGKSTWAKEYVLKNKNTVRVSNDELRLTCFNRQFDKGDTKFVDKARETLIDLAIREKKDVLIDNTNLSPKREEEYRALAKLMKYEFEIKDFTHIPLDECLKNDKNRLYPVGAKVILEMYNQFLKKTLEAPVYNVSLGDCIIVDLDNTLAMNSGHRGPYDFEKCANDTPNYALLRVLNSMLHNPCTKLIFMSGREDKFRSQSVEFINNCGLTFHDFFMRTTGDNRKDSIIKKELYEKHIKNKYNVMVWFDDRLQVVDMVRNELGLPCFAVNDGYF